MAFIEISNDMELEYEADVKHWIDLDDLIADVEALAALEPDEESRAFRPSPH